MNRTLDLFYGFISKMNYSDNLAVEAASRENIRSLANAASSISFSWEFTSKIQEIKTDSIITMNVS